MSAETNELPAGPKSLARKRQAESAGRQAESQGGQAESAGNGHIAPAGLRPQSPTGHPDRAQERHVWIARRGSELDEGRRRTAANGQRPDADVQSPSPTGHNMGAGNGQQADARRGSELQEGQDCFANECQIQHADLQSICDQIRAHHRQRCFAMEQRKRCDLAIGSYLRTVLGWRRDLPEAERHRIAKLANDLIICGEKDSKEKPHALSSSEEYLANGHVIAASLTSRVPWDSIEEQAKSEMAKLAHRLDAWSSFGEAIRGFGPVSLAVIIGEAGNLSNYSTHSKLWKRMSLAVIDGKRQGGLPKTASKEAWIKHGYNRQRRSRMWNVGDSLIKGNGDGKYRTIYLARKEYERARAIASGLQVVPAAKIPKKTAALYMSDGHVHRSAQRYMEKRLLRDLWRAWRAITGLPLANDAMPITSPET